MEYVTISGVGRVAVPFPGDRLTDDEESYLRQSFSELGIVVPVVVYTSKLWGDALIQGYNRNRLGTQLGIPVPVDHKGAMDDDRAKKFASDIQAAGRQLTPAQVERARRERNERVVAARSEGRSFRSIAEKEDISHEEARRITNRQANPLLSVPLTVEQESEECEDEPVRETPPPVIGSNGKTYRQPPLLDRSSPAYERLEAAKLLTRCRRMADQLAKDMDLLLISPLAKAIRKAANTEGVAIAEDGEWKPLAQVRAVLTACEGRE